MLIAGTLPQELIRKKRDGQALSAEEIRAFLAAVTDGRLPDYQIAAMLMAIFWRGMDTAELAAWADGMVHSGDVIDLSPIERPKIDKHSTGGVGDKISIPLAPAVAACGVAVPMISGRSLGHSGGTLDKLQSIPGFRVDLPVEHFAQQVEHLGTCLIGQTERLAPADRRLYALRDVTATVECVPLIASSIMSKKLAEGIDGLVLDCKVGQGAFMRTREDARALGQAIQGIGRAAGKPVTVVLTDMNTPIGRAVGNALEIAESIDTLRGGGPADTRELTVCLGAEMLLLAGVVSSVNEGTARIAAVLDNGQALEVFRRVIEAQGGDARVIDDPERYLPKARHVQPLLASEAGYVQAVWARDIGVASMLLGAGRSRAEDAVDPAVGIQVLVRPGDRVEAGQELARLVHNDREVERATELSRSAFVIGPEAPARAGSAGAATRILEVMR